MSELREMFRTIFRRHVAGVTVVTFTVDGELAGFTATSVISVAAAPPSIAFAVSRASGAGMAVAGTSEVIINFLDDASDEVATRFAMRGGDRFLPGSYDLTDDGVPYLPGASAWLRASIVARHDVADSVLIVGEVTEIEVTEGELAPLVYLDRQYRRLAPITTGE
ncbi:flavin reductase family protein [Bowdeniella massiliensis]|uniref:flavin reductase family protein n=1 Tax=Bowdeniella massiliensis TaxID=2932264 RepID=UPI002027C0CB|nr:flavin reductase family protein [Bowdeniella massiliensis]